MILKKFVLIVWVWKSTSVVTLTMKVWKDQQVFKRNCVIRYEPFFKKTGPSKCGEANPFISSFPCTQPEIKAINTKYYKLG